MTDVFIRVWSPTELRFGMAVTTIARWAMQSDVDLHLVVCEATRYWWGAWDNYSVCKLPEANFTAASVEWIERTARGPVYIGSDDDMLIYGKDFVERGLALMEENLAFGMVSASPTNEFDASGGNPAAIVPSWSIGGPMFVRKGILTEFPPLTNSEYAPEMDRQCRLRGMKQGYFRDIRYLHLGSKYSFASPVHYVGA